MKKQTIKEELISNIDQIIKALFDNKDILIKTSLNGLIIKQVQIKKIK